MGAGQERHYLVMFERTRSSIKSIIRDFRDYNHSNGYDG